MAKGAHAHEQVLNELMRFGEVVVPDLRFEYVQKPYVVLSLPAHFTLSWEKDCSHYPPCYVTSAFVEPQWRPADGQWRALIGVRQTYAFIKDTFGLLGEAAALTGTDGHGVVLGAGPSFLHFEGEMCGTVLSVVYRHSFTTEGHRDDVSIDLMALGYNPCW
jgi:hypothetical protein